MYERIQQLLNENSMRAGDLSKAVGIPASTLSTWKAGHTKSVNSENAAKIAAYFGVSVEWLLGKTNIRGTAGKEINVHIRPSGYDVKTSDLTVHLEMFEGRELTNEELVNLSYYVTELANNEDLRTLFDSLSEISPENIKLITEFAKALNKK